MIYTTLLPKGVAKPKWLCVPDGRADQNGHYSIQPCQGDKHSWPKPRSQLEHLDLELEKTLKSKERLLLTNTFEDDKRNILLRNA